MTYFLYLIVLLILALVASSILRNIVHSRIDHTTVASFDLERYMGTWYEIARLENRFERGMTGVMAQYRLLGDRAVEVVNRGTCPGKGSHKTSIGRAKPTDVKGRLRVSFFWLFSSDYNVLELDDAYSWALVGSHSPRHLWILSRTPTLPKEIIDDLLIRAQARGYDSDQVIMVDQSANYGT